MQLSSDASRRSYVLPCALVVVACVLAQLVLGGRINLFGATPNFMLCAVFFVALKAGRAAGVVAGFALGLLFDLLGSSTLGLSSLVACLFGYGCTFVGKPAILGEPLRACRRFLACAFGYNALRYALLVFLGVQSGLGVAALGRIALSAVLDTLAALVVCAVYSRASRTRRTSLEL